MTLSSTSEIRSDSQVRSYERALSAVFLKTTEGFGGLSNMAGGFPLRVNGIRIYSAEALYQACRFPHLPEVQRLILSESSPMTAKMKTRPYRKDSRPDWDRVRVRIMRWCLRVKLAQNWRRFGDLLLETGDMPIVEESRKDGFWGAYPQDRQTLVGMNVLGRLLMELREELKSERRDELLRVEPLPIPDFLLMGQPIQPVEAFAIDSKRTVTQTSLFDTPGCAAEEQTSIVYANPRITIDSLHPYPEYQCTGLPWLGQVPGHWEILPHRALFEEIKERDHPSEQMLSVTITRGVIKQRELLSDSSKKDSSKQDKSAYKLVCPGDIAYNKMRAWQGAIGVSNLRGIISPAYIVQRLREKQNPKYFHHLFRTPAFAKEAERWSYGITSDMWSLRPEHFKAIYSPLPPPDEQAAIVRFLDHAKRRLDRAIHAKRKIIALLNEQKQAIIHRAVTRGLNPDAPLKDSGIPWLGEIPVHWEVRRVKQISKILRGKFTHRPRNDASLYDGPYPFIQTGAVAKAKKFITTYKQTLNQKGLSVSKMFPAGTLVMTIAANIGDVAILTFDSCFPDSIVGFVHAGKIDRDYLYLVFFCMKPELLREAPVNTQGNLNVERIGAMGIPLPLLEEQTEIVRYVDSETSSLGSAVSRIEREIDLLREYRTRLIADVVTGKLDVRTAASRLPVEEAAAPDIEEDADDELEEAA